MTAYWSIINTKIKKIKRKSEQDKQSKELVKLSDTLLGILNISLGPIIFEYVQAAITRQVINFKIPKTCHTEHQTLLSIPDIY